MSIIQLLLFAVGLMAFMTLGYLAFSGPSAAKEGARRLEALRYRHSESTKDKVEAQLKKAVAARKPKVHQIAGSESRIAALALRLLGGLEAQSDALAGRAEVEWVDGQDRIAAFETATKGYTMVNASLNWKPFAAAPGTSLTLSANNIFDVVARRHASFLKDYAPLAGRDIRVSARVAF